MEIHNSELSQFVPYSGHFYDIFLADRDLYFSFHFSRGLVALKEVKSTCADKGQRGGMNNKAKKHAEIS